MELRRNKMSKYSVKKPVIVKHQSLEPQKGKSEKDRIRFLEDEIREYKRLSKGYLDINPGNNPSFNSK